MPELNKFSGNIQQDKALYFYQSTSPGDAIDDIRISNQNGVYSIQKCTVANVTKGGGTWVDLFISAYISNATAISLLIDTDNWDIDGIYTGITITGTYQGQKHYNSDYYFECVEDNVWVRLPRA